MHIARHKEIQPPVAVVVAPSCAGRPAACRDPGFLSNISKGAIVVVMEEPIFTVVRHVNIRPAVIVVVAHDRTKAPTVIRYAGLRSGICKCAVVVVVEERGMRRRGFPGKCVKG